MSLQVSKHNNQFVGPVIAIAAATLLLGASWAISASTDDSEFFAASGSRYAPIIQRSEAAFMNRDVAGSTADLDADYVLYDILEDGAIERIRGVENVRSALGKIFESGVWLSSEVDRLALVDNTLVQIEHDTFKTEDGEKTISTLVVFEHRNGKRWREWRYIPADR
jgi:hypothetical protein